MLLFTRGALDIFSFFFFNDTATTEIYTLSLHDALPISASSARDCCSIWPRPSRRLCGTPSAPGYEPFALEPKEFHRSEEHTSELQSRLHLVCRLLLEKKKNKSSMPSNR